MVLPQYYPQVPPSAIASYNYTDIGEGTGVTLFYAFVSEDDTAKDYHMTTDSALYSTEIDEVVATADAAFTKKLDYDFDLTTFNLPKTIKGTAIVTFPIGARLVGTTSDKSVQTYAIVKLRKWDGAAETEIVSEQSFTVTNLVGDSTAKRNVTLSMIVPQIHFKKGETLRMTVELWAKMITAGGGNSNQASATIGHDPANRDGSYFTAATNPTSMILRMPFRLDI